LIFFVTFACCHSLSLQQQQIDVPSPMSAGEKIDDSLWNLLECAVLIYVVGGAWGGRVLLLRAHTVDAPRALTFWRIASTHARNAHKHALNTQAEAARTGAR
jgi:hypothetical protein